MFSFIEWTVIFLLSIKTEKILHLIILLSTLPYYPNFKSELELVKKYCNYIIIIYILPVDKKLGNLLEKSKRFFYTSNSHIFPFFLSNNWPPILLLPVCHRFCSQADGYAGLHTCCILTVHSCSTCLWWKCHL